MKMKRIMLLAMILVLMAAAGGCKSQVGTTEDNALKSEEDQKDKPKYKFGFSCITMENDYFITLESSIREQLEKEGHSLIVKDPGMNAETQITQIEEMIKEEIDAIFLSPVDWETITPALEELKAAGIKIINIDTEVKDAQYVDAYIGSDNKNAGFICGEDLIKRCPDGGKIVILESLNVNSVSERITGFEEAIAQAQNGFTVVRREDCKGDLNLSISTMADVFAKEKDIVAVMCGNDVMLVGALTSANQANIENIWFYGVDGSPDVKKELNKTQSLVAGTVAQSPISIGKAAAKTALAILNGEEYEKEIHEEVFFIDKDNVDMFGTDGWQ